MNLLVERAVGFLGLYVAFFSFTSPALGQITTMYPGSAMLFLGHREGAAISVGCPPGSNASAFANVIIANGWDFNVDGNIERQSRTGAGGSNESSFHEYSLVSIHPESKRMRHWLVTDTYEITRQLGITVIQCKGIAVLQGDRLDDGLSIDIGVLVTVKPVKGEQVSPIMVLPPFYCLRPWQTRKKDAFESGIRSFDCGEVGISVPTNGRENQTENLIK